MKRRFGWVRFLAVLVSTLVLLGGCSAQNPNSTKRQRSTSSESDDSTSKSTPIATRRITEVIDTSSSFPNNEEQTADVGLLELYTDMIEGARKELPSEIANLKTCDITVSMSRADELKSETEIYVNMPIDEITYDESSLRCYASYDMTSAEDEKTKGVALVLGVKAHIKSHKTEKKQDIETLKWSDVDVVIDNNFILVFKAICIGVNTDSSGNTNADNAEIQYDFSRTSIITMYCDYYIEDVSMLTDYLDERYLKNIWFDDNGRNYFGPEWKYSEMHAWDPWYKSYKINKTKSAQSLELYCDEETGIEPPPEWKPKD